VHVIEAAYTFEAYKSLENASRLDQLSNLLRQNVLEKHLTIQNYETVNMDAKKNVSVSDIKCMSADIKSRLTRILEYEAKLHEAPSSQGLEGKTCAPAQTGPLLTVPAL